MIFSRILKNAKRTDGKAEMCTVAKEEIEQ